MQAILIVGEQHSGTNLLRQILNSSPVIAAPYPSHILKNLMPLLPGYGDLNDEVIMAKLIDDVCRLVENNHVPWEGVRIFDRNQVRSLCRENSLIAVFAAVMQVFAQRHGASAWLCKSMHNIRWALELNDYLLRPKFIYLFRDPRDVALSFSRAVIGDKHPYHVIQKWAELQRLCLDAEKFLPPAQFMRVRYESLIREPEQIIRDVCGFLEIEFVPAMMEFYCSQEAERASRHNTLLANLNQPGLGDDARNILQEMPRSQIRIVESLAGDLIDRLGYKRYLVRTGEEIRYSAQQIEWFNAENEMAKSRIACRSDPEVLKRQQCQQNVLNDIRKSLEQMGKNAGERRLA